VDAKAAWPDRHIGCSISWLLRVTPAVKGKNELVVAIYLQRRRVVCGNRKTIDIPNGELERLGVTRWVKYRTLENLEKAGIITVDRSGKECPTVTFLDLPEGRRRKARKVTKQEANVTAATPWALAGMSRAAWYRQRQKESPNGAPKRS
jgi:hypothetical protein